MPEFFYFAEGLLPGGDKPPIRITYFEFNNQSQGLPFDTAIEIELKLMRRLLKAGYKKVNGVFPGTFEEAQQSQRVADALEETANKKTADTYLAGQMARLRMQTEALKENKNESPPQSPKGTLTPRDDDTTLVCPPPELHRRVSAPQPYTGALGDGLDITPLRASGSRAITVKDPKTKIQTTPTKSGKRTSFTVGATIQEENENED
jgi:hypothetical protein